jgi:hypothetical protein
LSKVGTGTISCQKSESGSVKNSYGPATLDKTITDYGTRIKIWLASITSVDGEEAGLLDGAEFVDHLALVLTRVTQLNLLKKG